MTAKIIVCKPDGTQTIELEELPDNWFDPVSEDEKEAE